MKVKEMQAEIDEQAWMSATRIEREACAKVCEDVGCSHRPLSWNNVQSKFASAIRARSTEER